MRRAFLLGFRRQLIGDAQRPREQVEVDADQPLGRLAPHRVRDGGAHVAPLGDVARVAEALHQLRPRAGDAAGIPAELGRLAREAVARQRRDHHVEGILGAPAVGGRIRERIDDLEQLDHGSRPAVRDDHRHRVRVARLDVDEVDVHAVDLRHELRVGIQPGLGLPPVVVRRPVADELFERRELHALRPIPDELLGGPARGREAPAEVVDLGLGYAYGKGADRAVVARLERSGRRGKRGEDEQARQCSLLHESVPFSRRRRMRRPRGSYAPARPRTSRDGRHLHYPARGMAPYPIRGRRAISRG